jgi:hypothetical protein
MVGQQKSDFSLLVGSKSKILHKKIKLPGSLNSQACIQHSLDQNQAWSTAIEKHNLVEKDKKTVNMPRYEFSFCDLPFHSCQYVHAFSPSGP